MTKRQLIDQIITVNQTAKPDFLARFDDSDLDEYLQHLQLAQTPRLPKGAHNYDRYFTDCPTIPTTPKETDPVDKLDLNVSENALFSDSYETPAA